jgi:colanic acid biosynthesis glycosyl transferase WcaI
VKIILISQYYWPESFGAGVWHAALAEWLTGQGHDVTVLTGFPNYPDGIVFAEYRRRVLQREEHNGVQIIRTWLYATQRTLRLWQRVLGQASFSVTFLLGAFFAPRADVVWYESPPLPGTLTSWIVARAHGAGYALTLADLEPQRSVAIGLFRNRPLIWLLENIERTAYRHADRLCVLSEGTKNWLINGGVNADKIRITPNWADGDLIRPLPVSESLREELGIGKNEFVVLYSGNMGYTMSDLEGVVEAAHRLSGYRDIRFVFAGDGVRRDSIETLAAGLKQAMFLPIQSLDRYPRLLATADLCLVVLNREGTYTSVPSKTYSIMAAGKPVLAICESDNDVARVVREADCGAQVFPGDIDALVDSIQSYRNNPLLVEEQGARARAYFEQHYSRSIGMAAYERVFAEICGRPHRNAVLADTPQP